MSKKRLRTILETGTVLLVLASILFFPGCGTPAQEPQENGVAPGYEEPERTVVEVSYTVIDDESSLPQGVQEDMSLLRNHRGYFVFAPPAYDTGGDVYLVVYAGEKPTGGYRITLHSLEKRNATLYLEVEEKVPAEDEMVIQVLTYPTLIVKLDHAYDSYEIAGIDNEPFPKISEERIPQRQEARGIYNGQIDNNFIEISVDGTAGAYLLPEDLSWVLAELLNSGDTVVFTYYKNEHGQQVIRELNTAERAAMIHNVRGIFTGQIDSNSVEIVVQGNPAAYVPVEQIVISVVNEGDKVIFEYYEDQHGRRIINRMEKE
jgi:hypothetical protein